MNNKRICVVAALLLMACGVWAQDPSVATQQNEEPKVSISVQDTDMLSVLRLLSEQADSGVVIGPEVASTRLNLDLKDVYLTDALDVILKPHGYGYRKVGETIVVDKLENLQRVASVEPLASRVFKLKYLNADDVIDVAKGLLSSRGTCKVLYVAPKQGWKFSQSGNSDNSAAKLDRVSVKGKTASKTLIVNDIPSVLTQVEQLLAEIDSMPRQVEISSYFIEMKEGALKDIGVSLSMANISPETNVFARTLMDLVEPVGYPDSSQTSIKSTATYNAGMLFGLLHNDDNLDLSAQLRAIEENGDINILSAPRIVAQDNQEAAIVVGKKVPIISTKTTTGDNPTFTTSLEYYERIGIQLNVVPQICENGMINMVVHPSVTEQSGTAQGVTAGSSTSQSTDYPIIQTREAETRLTVHDGDTIAIGGLINDRQVETELKVPLLGDIPYIGRLFRRDMNYNEKIELVILLTAQIKEDLHSDADQIDQHLDRSAAKLIDQWDGKSKPATEEETESVEDILTALRNADSDQ